MTTKKRLFDTLKNKPKAKKKYRKEVPLKTKEFSLSFNYKEDKHTLEELYFGIVEKLREENIPLDLILAELNFKKFHYYKIKNEKKKLMKKLSFGEQNEERPITFSDNNAEFVIKFK